MKQSIFRAIRRKLLEEGKLLRYLTYALGEIVLIVVGILLALKISDWNEDQKAQVEFDEYVVQLREDVELAISVAEERAQRADLVNTFRSLREEIMQALSHQPELQRRFSMIDREDGQSDNFLPSSLARRVREDNEVISLAAVKGQHSRVIDMNLGRVQDASTRIVKLIQETR